MRPGAKGAASPQSPKSPVSPLSGKSDRLAKKRASLADREKRAEQEASFVKLWSPAAEQAAWASKDIIRKFEDPQNWKKATEEGRPQDMALFNVDLGKGQLQELKINRLTGPIVDDADLKGAEQWFINFTLYTRKYWYNLGQKEQTDAALTHARMSKQREVAQQLALQAKELGLRPEAIVAGREVSLAAAKEGSVLKDAVAAGLEAAKASQDAADSAKNLPGQPSFPEGYDAGMP
eukprot:TRINITY_DN66214_c0_g1_i1.p1 TRINITY_DN66214_c0_g1~~TRINITY_DN66214_c0_g1_i1.p1  ORF type:complete len:235 (-),score=58.05 TRINITY_DN66214_c0_g1_i1:56-760(-)